MYTCITGKGQIVIPTCIRRKFDLKEGTRIHIDIDGQMHCIILTPITREHGERLRGYYRGRGLLKALAVAKKREKEL